MLSTKKLSLKIYEAKKCADKIKSWVNINVSVQESYEQQIHEINNKVQNIKTYENYKNLFFIKTKQASRYMYVFSKLKVYIHIPNTNEFIIEFYMKASDSRIYMYIY